MLLGIAGVFIVSLFIVPFLGSELFPQLDSGQFIVLVRAPSGTRMENTEKIARRVESVVRSVIPAGDLQMVVSNTGILYDWPAAYTSNAGPHEAFVLVQLQKSHRKRTQVYANVLRRKLADSMPGIRFAFDTGGLISSALNFGLLSPIDIQVEGPKLETANQIAGVGRKRVTRIPGAVDVRIQQNLDYPQITLDVDRTRAASISLTEEDIVKNVVTALNSSTTFLPSFWVDEKSGNHYFVGATYREKSIPAKRLMIFR